MDDYIRNPKNLKLLSAELKKICDDYWSGKTSEQTLRVYVHYIAENYTLLAENGKDLNITVKLAIGKKRINLVLKMLSDYQLRLL